MNIQTQLNYDSIVITYNSEDFSAETFLERVILERLLTVKNVLISEAYIYKMYIKAVSKLPIPIAYACERSFRAGLGRMVKNKKLKISYSSTGGVLYRRA